MECQDIIIQYGGKNKALMFMSPSSYPISYQFDPTKNVSMFSEFLEATKVNKFDMEAKYQMKHEVHRLG